MNAFENAAKEFNVPADLLKGISFTETRWQHLQWAEGDTANCMGMPHAYGVMGLRDDDWFGHSLREAAQLINQDPEVLKNDLIQNIRGGAALLRKLYDELPLPEGTSRGDIESWQNAVAKYPGIPQPELSSLHAFEVFERLSKGYRDYGIELNKLPIRLEPIRQRVVKIWNEAKQTQKLNKTADQPDYQGAKWNQAYPGHWYTDGYARDFVVIHDMEGYYLATISYFQQSATQASVHYCTNGLQDSPTDMPPGDITQMVEEKYWAWHVRCWNRYMLGIEHEGFAGNPAWYTPEMYIASAKLTKYLCDKYNIPKDRNHIIAHGEWLNSAWTNWINSNYKTIYPTFDPTCNDHTDPGPFWDWGFYMQLVKQDSTPPHVVSTPPTQPIQVYDKISVTFDQRMHRVKTESNFKLSPSVQGSFSWSIDFRTLSFTPSSSLAFNTTYAVTVDTGAVNYLNVGLDVNGDGKGGDVYSFTFRTVQRDTIPPQIASTYPADNQTDISPSVELIVVFNEPMDPSTLSGSFQLKTQSGQSVPLSVSSTASNSGATRVNLKAAAELNPASTYQFIINQQARDYGGNSITAPRTITFTTEPIINFSGTVINSVESIGDWWQPSTSGSTVNVVASFSIVNDVKKAGTGSGKLAYSFTNTSGGVIREHTPTIPSVEGNNLVAAWIYGDNSGHNLEYWFYYYTTNSSGGTVTNFIAIPVAKIDWTGWKLKTLSTSLIPRGTTGVRRFTSFVVKQVSGGAMSGTLYFDELTTGSAVTEVERPRAQTIPTQFKLHQNFPNPFNPTTTIEYEVPAETQVKLAIYNSLGQEVQVLVNEPKSPGRYAVKFDASELPSGVYFYKLIADQFVGTKKMILLR